MCVFVYMLCVLLCKTYVSSICKYYLGASSITVFGITFKAGGLVNTGESLSIVNVILNHICLYGHMHVCVTVPKRHVPKTCVFVC